MKKHFVFGATVAALTLLSLFLQILYFGPAWFPAVHLLSAFLGAAVMGFLFSVVRDRWTHLSL